MNLRETCMPAIVRTINLAAMDLNGALIDITDKTDDRAISALGRAMKEVGDAISQLGTLLERERLDRAFDAQRREILTKETADAK